MYCSNEAISPAAGDTDTPLPTATPGAEDDVMAAERDIAAH